MGTKLWSFYFIALYYGRYVSHRNHSNSRVSVNLCYMLFHRYQNIGFRWCSFLLVCIIEWKKHAIYPASPWWTLLCVVTLSQLPVNSHLSLIWICDKGTETLRHVWHEAEVRCYIWGEVYKQLSIEPLSSPSQWTLEYNELPLSPVYHQ